MTALFVSLFRNLFSRAFIKTPCDTENSDFQNDLEAPSPGKRSHDENSPDGVIPKKRKLNSTNFFGSSNSISTSKESAKMPMNLRHSRNTRANCRKSFGDFPNNYDARVKNSNIYSCEDDDDDSIGTANCKVLLQRTEKARVKDVGHLISKRMNVNTRQASTQFAKSFSLHMCQNSPLCLDRIQNEQERGAYLEMIKKNLAGTSTQKRKSLPLTTSTTHNTKNNQVIMNPAFERSYFLRSAKGNVSMEVTAPLKETVADRTVIDLTNDDEDDYQRQMIETNVRNSWKLKNFKTSFIGKDQPVTDPDFIQSLLKKYDLKQKTLDSNVKKMKNNIRKRNEDFQISLAEILEKRLVLKEHVVEEKPTKDLAPITKEMMAEMRKILSCGKSTLVQIKDTGIKAQDIYTLHDCGWLNDEKNDLTMNSFDCKGNRRNEDGLWHRPYKGLKGYSKKIVLLHVINAYMNLIKIRSENDGERYPKVHCFNTFFYPQLLTRGYSSVRRWTKKIDVFDHTIIIVPIHLGNHWCLTEIRTKENLIKYYDSFGSPNNRCLETILQYLVNEYADKKGGELSPSDWQVINVPRDEIPNQRNAYDCGVFACTYAEHITRNASFNFQQEDMSYFREKMTYEILTKNLLL